MGSYSTGDDGNPNNFVLWRMSTPILRVEESFWMLLENSFVVDGTVSLDDFCEQFDMECDYDNVSLGGWAVEQVNCIPDEGDSFTYENCLLR